MGVRIHTLAKKLNLSSKELMAVLRKNGIKINSHLSSLHNDIAGKIIGEVFGAGAEAEAKDGSATKTAKAPQGASASKDSSKEAAVEKADGAAKASIETTRPEVQQVDNTAASKIAGEATGQSKVAENSAAPAAKPAESAAQTTAAQKASTPASAASSDSSSSAGISSSSTAAQDSSLPSPPATQKNADTLQKASVETGHKVVAEKPKASANAGSTTASSTSPDASKAAPPTPPKPKFIPKPAAPKRRPIIARSKTPPTQNREGNRGRVRYFPGQEQARGPGGTPTTAPGRAAGPGGKGRGPSGPGSGGGGNRGGSSAPGGGARSGSAGSSAPAMPQSAPSSDTGRSRSRRGPGGGPGGPGGAGGGRRGTGGPGGAFGRRGGGRGGRGGGRGGDTANRGSGFSRKRDVLAPDRPTEVEVQLPITMKDLSPILGIKVPMIQGALLNEGVMTNINSHLSEEMLLQIGLKFEVEIEIIEEAKIESTLQELEQIEGADEDRKPRAPVVTFLGHVDHGKTSLLDKIRESRVATGEAGGITQHMSAYRIDHGDRSVVFIDTPGHKAFTEMRARGANVTDVVVLVVAADDGPMPQTEEAVQHARAAGVPIVVAINKVDRPNANVMRCKQELVKLELSPPEWGGNTEMVEVSAVTGQGIDDLIEILSLETEILDLQAGVNKPAIGTVLDSKATSGRGIVTTALVQEGVLRPGDYVLCGQAWGRVRTLQATTGAKLKSAGPSTPVEITGLDDLPEAGDRLYALDQAKARAIAEERKRKLRESERAAMSHVTLENLMSTLTEKKSKEVHLILKADVKGSLEVVKQQILELATDEVGFKILLGGVGEISESDILLADASDAIVIGFHVSSNDRAKSLADDKGVEIRSYQVIYQLLEDMKLALEGILEPEVYEEFQASIEIRQLYKSTKLGNIAGCYVTRGKVKRDHPIRVMRDGELIHSGKLSSLKRFKEDTKEVREGFECGIRIQGYNEVRVGDIIESYAVLKRARKLSDSQEDTKRNKEAKEAESKDKAKKLQEAKEAEGKNNKSSDKDKSSQ